MECLKSTENVGKIKQNQGGNPIEALEKPGKICLPAGHAGVHQSAFADSSAGLRGHCGLHRLSGGQRTHRRPQLDRDPLYSLRIPGRTGLQAGLGDPDPVSAGAGRAFVSALRRQAGEPRLQKADPRGREDPFRGAAPGSGGAGGSEGPGAGGRDERPLFKGGSSLPCLAGQPHPLLLSCGRSGGGSLRRPGERGALHLPGVFHHLPRPDLGSGPGDPGAEGRRRRPGAAALRRLWLHQASAHALRKAAG